MFYFSTIIIRFQAFGEKRCFARQAAHFLLYCRKFSKEWLYAKNSFRLPRQYPKKPRKSLLFQWVSSLRWRLLHHNYTICERALMWHPFWLYYIVHPWYRFCRYQGCLLTYSIFNCRSCGTISATVITNAIQSAKGVAHAMPETPTAPFRISMNTTSRLPLRSSDSKNGWIFLPIAWKTVMTMKLTAVVSVVV